jgi:transketolase
VEKAGERSTRNLDREQARHGFAGWERYVGPKRRVIGMHTFGGSAPVKALLGKFGFDAGSILKVAREMLSSS